MLDKLRKGASGWVAQLFIALLVVSFAVWGVSDIFSGFRGDTVATVGKTDITIQQFQRQYEIATRALGQQLGQQVSAEQAQMFGVPGQVLGRLVGDATLDDQAASLGLGVSSQTMAQQIADDPSFRGASGTFDRNQFADILRTNGLSEDRYIEELRQNYLRQQIANALVGATEAPDAYLKALHEFRSEERDITYLVLTAALVGDVGAPSDADLAKYFEANKAQWRAPEFRAVKVVAMAPADLADVNAVSDDDARKTYDTLVASRFTTPERRKVEQMVFKDKAEAEAAAAALTSGKTFDELIVERKLAPADVDLGLVTRDKIIDPAVAEAAFALAASGVSGVIDGQFGPVIVRVTTIEPQVVKTFDEVKAEIKQELATQRASAEISDQLNAVEDARAAGETLDEIAAKYGLKVETISAIDKSGKDADGKAIADLPGGAALVSGVFDTDVGLENDPVGLAAGGYAWYEVTAVTAERDRELAEVRDKVVADWKANQVRERLVAKANEVRDRLGRGDDIAKVAAELGVTPQTAARITRGGQPPEGLSAAAIQAAFAGPKDHAGVAAGATPETQIVVFVKDVALPPYDPAALDMTQAKEQLGAQIANDLLSQYVGQLQSALGLSVNQTALAQAIGAPGS